MKDTKEIQKPVCIALPDSLKKKIEKKAKEEGRSTSNLIRHILVNNI